MFHLLLHQTGQWNTKKKVTRFDFKEDYISKYISSHHLRLRCFPVISSIVLSGISFNLIVFSSLHYNINYLSTSQYIISYKHILLMKHLIPQRIILFFRVIAYMTVIHVQLPFNSIRRNLKGGMPMVN